MRLPVPDDDATGSGPDPWQLAGLPGGLVQASYLTGPLAAQYRVIVDVLLEQQQFTLTGVAAAELPDLLRKYLTGRGVSVGLLDDPGFVLRQRMDSLQRWGVVDIFQDKAIRDSDFVRDLDRYQLTEIGAELHRAVTGIGQDNLAAAAATLAPSVLTAQLTRLLETITSDPVAAAEAWSVITTTHQSMAKAARGWRSRLAGALAGNPTPEKIAIVQETLRRYVDMWGAGIDTHSETITARVAALATIAAPVWRRVAVHTLGANADDAALEQLAASHRQTLTALSLWFDGPDGQAQQLRRQMRDTIGPLLRGQRTLAAVGGHVSRRTELLALATRIEAAGDDDTAWQTWCAATGLYAARHLPLPSPMPAGNPGASSFWDADPAPVEARLRKFGPRATRGTAARMPDRSHARRLARLHGQRAAADAAHTEAGILARSGLRLSQWTAISTAELHILVVLLGAVAAGHADADGVRTATTGDQRWLLRAEPPDVAAASAVIATPEGRLVHPDIRLHISPAGRAA